MAANQPEWPRYWLMTDERIGDRLWEAIGRLPTGKGGIVFRHYRLGDMERLALGRRLADAAKDRGLLLAVAGSRDLAEKLGSWLVHNPTERGALPFSAAVHDGQQALDARLAGAALAFVSPVRSTRSHPDRRPLGAARAAKLAAMCGCPAVALGGMNAARFDELESAFPGAFHGYAGIDCWLSERLRT